MRFSAVADAGLSRWLTPKHGVSTMWLTPRGLADSADGAHGSSGRALSLGSVGLKFNQLSDVRR
jgi:hypothetical protein